MSELPAEANVEVGREIPAWDGVERRSGTDRRRVRVYRFIDRRHGFDRRQRHPALAAMRDRPWILLLIIIALNVLSLVDGYFTIAELQLGLAAEGNPILDAIAQQNRWMAIWVKVGSVLLVSVIVWLGRKRRIFLQMAIVALVVFGTLAAYHWSYLHQLGYL